MELVSTRSGRRDKPPPRICTKTTATEHLPTSQKSRGWHAPAGRQASASGTTTTTGGMICSVVSGDTTFCSTITVTAHLLTELEKRVFTMSASVGAPVAHFSTTIATAISTCSSATTFSLILQRQEGRASPPPVSGREFQ